MCWGADVKASEKHSASPSTAQRSHPHPCTETSNRAMLCDTHDTTMLWSTYSVAIFLYSASFFLFWKEPFFLLNLEEKRDMRWSLAPARRFSAGHFPKIAESVIFVQSLMLLSLLTGQAGCRQAGDYTTPQLLAEQIKPSSLLVKKWASSSDPQDHRLCFLRPGSSLRKAF